MVAKTSGARQEGLPPTALRLALAVLIAAPCFASGAGDWQPWTGGDEITAPLLRERLKGLKHPYLFMTADQAVAENWKVKLLQLKAGTTTGGAGSNRRAAADLLSYGVAYDMVAASGLLSTEEEKQIADALTAYASNALSVEVLSPKQQANGAVRVSGGAGIALLAVGDHTAPAGNALEILADELNEWFGSSKEMYHRKGITSVYNDERSGVNLINWYCTPDGGYMEGGVDYFEDAFGQEFQLFLHACRKTIGIDFWSYRDKAGVQRRRRRFECQLKITMPDLVLPNIGDSENTRAKFNEMQVLAYPDCGVFPWYARQVGVIMNAEWFCKKMETGDAALFLRSCCDPAAKAVSPQQAGWTPTNFFPAGQFAAVLRSDWSREATYLLLQARNRPSCSHIHPDQTSFMVHAKGAYMLVDAGDVRPWPSAGWVNRKDLDIHTRAWAMNRGHNLVMVDDDPPAAKLTYGQPTGSDPAYLRRRFASEFVDYASVEMTYGKQKVDATRDVLFPNHCYFIVCDDLRSRETHDYDFQLHFGGGKDKKDLPIKNPDYQKFLGTASIQGGGTLKIAGGDVTWEMRNLKGDPVEIRSFFASPDALDVTQHTGGSKYYAQNLVDHAYIKAHVKGRNVRYLCVLLPRKLAEPAAKIEKMAEGGVRGAKIEAADRTDYVALGGGVGPAKDSKGELVFASTKQGKLDYFMVKNGVVFRFEGKEIFSSARPVTAALRLQDGKLAGVICADGGAGRPVEWK